MFVEDLTPFFDVDAIGVSIATVGGVAGIGVQFDNDYALGNVGMLGMAGSQPAIVLPSVSVPVDPIGTAVLITAGPGIGSYLVAEHKPDGSGVSRLVLEVSA
jgi:hypothetical protein